MEDMEILISSNLARSGKSIVVGSKSQNLGAANLVEMLAVGCERFD